MVLILPWCGANLSVIIEYKPPLYCAVLWVSKLNEWFWHFSGDLTFHIAQTVSVADQAKVVSVERTAIANVSFLV